MQRGVASSWMVAKRTGEPETVSKVDPKKHLQGRGLFGKVITQPPSNWWFGLVVGWLRTISHFPSTGRGSNPNHKNMGYLNHNPEEHEPNKSCPPRGCLFGLPAGDCLGECNPLSMPKSQVCGVRLIAGECCL